ncbi:MAG: LemA family protein [Myxococcales bacterium]|nr:LemA family protein [Myxococcales bacterium]MCB9708198.1 LemA family protein [Myxococcales bacterium]
MVGWILLGVVVVLALFAVGLYNGLVRIRNQVKNSWNQIDVQLKRRHDLIPNLVETAKGYMQHERGTLEAVTQARASAMQPAGRPDQIEKEQQLGQSLMNLMAVAERYPDLKANQNFLSLQEELSSTENRIAFSRQHYNDSVMGYNDKRQQFPSVVVANMFNFAEEPYWKIDDAAQREVPAVKF